MIFPFFDDSFLVGESMANLPKHPLKRFEPTLRKFQVALPADLARLQQHKINMEKVSLNIVVFNRLYYWNRRGRPSDLSARYILDLDVSLFRVLVLCS